MVEKVNVTRVKSPPPEGTLIDVSSDEKVINSSPNSGVQGYRVGAEYNVSGSDRFKGLDEHMEPEGAVHVPSFSERVGGVLGDVARFSVLGGVFGAGIAAFAGVGVVGVVLLGGISSAFAGGYAVVTAPGQLAGLADDPADMPELGVNLSAAINKIYNLTIGVVKGMWRGAAESSVGDGMISGIKRGYGTRTLPDAPIVTDYTPPSPVEAARGHWKNQVRGQVGHTTNKSAKGRY